MKKNSKTIEFQAKTIKEKKDGVLFFIRNNYKKITWTIFLTSLVLSFFFYSQTETVLHIAPIETFTWLFLIVSIVAFVFRDKIETFFQEKLYNDDDYLDAYYSKIDKLTDEQKAKADSPSQPLKKLMLFINGFLWLNFIFFVIGKAIGGYVGFNVITSPVAVLCVFGQMYLAYKTIQLMSKNVILLIKLKTED
jgi:hypothetical protein